jgi:hypothetical protein
MKPGKNHTIYFIMNEENILYDEQERAFILRLAGSYYAMRVREDGALVHAGSDCMRRRDTNGSSRRRCMNCRRLGR